jgi:dual specificity MAP kinase phosphatase
MQKYIDLSHIYQSEEDNFHKGNLYLGSASVIKDLEELKKYHVDCILTILDDWAYPKFKIKERIEHAQISVSHRISLEDDEEATILPELGAAVQFIKANLQKTNVFVHCQAGVSRSSTIVIAFLMHEKGWTRDVAKAYVKDRRKCISPNDTFWK